MLVIFHDTSKGQYKLCCFNPQEPDNQVVSRMTSKLRMPIAFYLKMNSYVDIFQNVSKWHRQHGNTDFVTVCSMSDLQREDSHSSMPQKHGVCFYKTLRFKEGSSTVETALNPRNAKQSFCVCFRTKLLSHLG